MDRIHHYGRYEAMSEEAIDWAFNIAGPRLADRLVLLALADYADLAGTARPTVRQVAERTGLSMDAARAALRRVERAGYVAIEQRRAPGAMNEYVLNMASTDDGTAMERMTR